MHGLASESSSFSLVCVMASSYGVRCFPQTGNIPLHVFPVFA